MKKPVRPITEGELSRDFPIKGKAPGWYFRTEETSNGVYEVEGKDVEGRRVYRQGTENPEKLLAECESDAAQINVELNRA